MSTREEHVAAIHSAIARLVAGFPRVQMGEPTIDAFVWGLADLPSGEVERAVRLAIRTLAFPPTVSELRAIVAEQRCPLPVGGVALEAVERYVRADAKIQTVPCPAGCNDGWQDHERQRMCATCRGNATVRGKNTVEIPDEARRALAAVGGCAGWRGSDSPSVIRAQFMRLYEQFAAESRRAIIEGDLAALPAGRQQAELTRASSG